MALTSILVHLAHDRDSVARLRVAVALAQRFKARLTGAYTARAAAPTSATGRAATLLGAEARAVAREQMDAAEAGFHAACQAAGVEGEFLPRLEETDVTALLAELSLVHDLAIVSQIDAATVEDLLTDEQPDHLAMVGAAPTLVLPYDFPGQTVGSRVVIGWDGKRAASVAVRHALPLLAAASKVTIATVSGDEALQASAIAAQRWLAGHGIEAELADVPRGDEDTGDALVTFCERHEGDLLVAGGSDHSKLRQLIAGGTSQTLLAGCPVPLLMGH